MATFIDKSQTRYPDNYAPTLEEGVKMDSTTVTMDSTDVLLSGWDTSTTYPKPNFVDKAR